MYLPSHHVLPASPGLSMIKEGFSFYAYPLSCDVVLSHRGLERSRSSWSGSPRRTECWCWPAAGPAGSARGRCDSRPSRWSSTRTWRSTETRKHASFGKRENARDMLDFPQQFQRNKQKGGWKRPSCFFVLLIKTKLPSAQKQIDVCMYWRRKECQCRHTAVCRTKGEWAWAKSLSHGVLEGGRHDCFHFKTSQQMFGFSSEKCSGAESNNTGRVYQNNSL